MIIEAAQLSFTHEEASAPLLKDISFSLPRGSLTCLCGQNGGGKSTLLSILCGVRAQTSGHLTIANFTLPKQVSSFRGHVALTPQDPDLYILGALAREDLLLSIRPSDTVGRDKAFALADQFGLTPKLNFPIHHLSFGEKRKLCLASALAGISGKPLQLLLLDEPFAGLDYPSALAMRALLKTNQKEGLTQIVVTHDLEYIIDFADRCLLMKDGTIHFDGTPEKTLPHYESAGVRKPLPFHVSEEA